MPRKYFRKYLPSHESIQSHKHFGKLGRFLHHPNLWHLNRRSVSGGVAIGMFCGLIPGPFQMLGAALMAIPCRVNLPVALITTLYTNPFTIVPLYLIAYWIGSQHRGQQRHDDRAAGLLVGATSANGRGRSSTGRSRSASRSSSAW